MFSKTAVDGRVDVHTISAHLRAFCFSLYEVANPDACTARQPIPVSVTQCAVQKRCYINVRLCLGQKEVVLS